MRNFDVSDLTSSVMTSRAIHQQENISFDVFFQAFNLLKIFTVFRTGSLNGVTKQQCGMI